MNLIIFVLLYVVFAGIAMFFTARWDGKLDSYEQIDDQCCYWLIALFWPIAFPIFAAYVLARATADE